MYTSLHGIMLLLKEKKKRKITETYNSFLQLIGQRVPRMHQNHLYIQDESGGRQSLVALREIPLLCSGPVL